MEIPTGDDPMLIHSFKGHKDSINSLNFHPQLKQIVSGSQDSTVQVWNLKKTNQVYRFIGHKGPVNDVQFSPNGALIASASKDETIKIWNNTVEGTSVTIKAHNASIRSVDFSCDGQLLVSASDDKSIKVWNVGNQKFIYSLTGSQNWVRHAAFSPDCRLISSGGDDKVLRLWDTDQKQIVQEYHDHNGVIYHTQFHPDGTCLATASQDKKVKVFDFRAKRLIQHYDAHNDCVVKLAFHPTGLYLMSASNDSKLKIWDLRKGKLAYTLYGHSGASTSCAFSHLGDYFISGGSDCNILLWKSNFNNSGKELLETFSQKQTQKSAPKFAKKTNRDDNQNSLLQQSQLQQGGDSKSHQVNQVQNKSVLQEHSAGNEGKLVYSKADESFHKTSEWDLKKQTETKKQVPPEVTGALDRIYGQLEFITKTLHVLTGRVEQNEDQITKLNTLVFRELDKQKQIEENVYDLQQLKDISLNRDKQQNQSYQQTFSKNKFHPAPNN